MEDDFNTPLAIASLFDLVTYVNKVMHGKEEFTKDEIDLLAAAKGLLLELSAVFGLSLKKGIAAKDADEDAIIRLVEERDMARKQKDFKKSDELRKRLSDMGVILEDAKEGTVWRRKI